MEERLGIGQRVYVSIDHANVPDEASWLKAQGSFRFDCAEIYINDWAPVAGVHCGPGVIGLSFYAGNQGVLCPALLSWLKEWGLL